MDKLSASTDISNQIGALEFGDSMESYGDSVLEAAGCPTLGPTGYPAGQTPCCPVTSPAKCQTLFPCR